MQLDLSTPEILTPKRVVTEDLHSLGQHALDIVAHGGIKSGLSGGCRLLDPLLLCERTIATDESGSGSDEWKGPPQGK
ncbi:MAG: hypothetical protein ACJ8D9_27545 [Xanthobacteraceae bacterium]